MLTLLIFAFNLHAVTLDCEKPETRDLETWKKCQTLKYLAMGTLDLTGSVVEELSCYRCGFVRLKFKGGPYALRLRESRLPEALCNDANLNGVQFQGIKAPGFRARNCTFENADLTEAVLTQARFQGGHFRGASFRGADLSGAEFSEVDLRGADFRQALMSRARFKNVKTDSSTKVPEGFHWPR